ncbi:MAG: PilZ domain-containing protein [Proteobacteria bacterium]|nr:PilZ domain-containing protein [Pseudomonadota bacterium]MBU1714968.1 PilZ domain-containing protein [Pseudomonadota bacterium]
MRELWTDDRKKILNIITELINEKIPLKLYQQNSAPYTIYVREIIEKSNETLVLFFKPEDTEVSQETCFISYHPKGQPMYGFEGIPLLESKQHIAMVLPNKIYKVQRRKFDRIETPGNSRATFVIQNKQRIQNCQVKDFSLQGARLIGEIFGDIKEGDVLEPLSISLCSKYSTSEEKITLPQATVARVKKKGSTEKEVGIFFKIPNTNLDLLDILEVYISMRNIEEDNY